MANIFYYVNTGHRIGLDRFRRASAVIEALQDLDITLLTNDFRIASIAKEYSFKKGVGIDVIRNIPNIARRGDILIYDSPEHSDVILNDMRDYFSTLIRFTDDLDAKAVGDETLILPISGEDRNLPIASVFEEKAIKKDNVLLFFGDDDYEEDLLAWAKESEFKEVDCLLGFYFFLDAEAKLSPYFKNILDEDHYVQSIQECGLLITSSYQAALEASLSQTPVVYVQRVDYDQNYRLILERLGIYSAPLEAVTAETIDNWKKNIKPILVTNGAKQVAQIIKNTLT